MEKFVPYEKMSKKEKKKIDALKRSDWGLLNPTVRKFDNDKTRYSRKQKHKRAPERELFHYFIRNYFICEC